MKNIILNYLIKVLNWYNFDDNLVINKNGIIYCRILLIMSIVASLFLITINFL